MNWEIVAWLLLGAVGLFDSWLVLKGKETISKWTERQWPRGVDIAVAVALIVIKSGIIIGGGRTYSFDPVLFLLVGHMLLGNEQHGKENEKNKWDSWERWCVYGSIGILCSLLLVSIL